MRNEYQNRKDSKLILKKTKPNAKVGGWLDKTNLLSPAPLTDRLKEFSLFSLSMSLFI